MRFLSIDNKSEHFAMVQGYFNETIQPIYGDQTRALAKIGAARDRTCEVLLSDDNHVLGVLVYKNDLVGARNSLEVKTLGVVHPERNSGKGYGKMLLERAHKVCEVKKSRGIKLTLSTLNNAKNFFKKYAFKVENEKPKSAGDKAAELHCRARINELGAALKATRSEGKASRSGGAEAFSRGSARSGDLKRSRKDESDTGNELHHSKRPREAFSGGQRSAAVPPPPPRGFSSGAQQHGSRGGHQAAPQAAFARHDPRMFAPRVTQRACTLMRKYVNYIASEAKPYEARCNTQMFRNYKVGDQVKWFAGQAASVNTKIIAVEKFASFKEMLEKNGYEGYVPDATSLAHAIRVYDNIPGYKLKAEKNGVVSFKLEVIKPDQAQSQSARMKGYGY